VLNTALGIWSPDIGFLLEANPERLSKCRNVLPNIKPTHSGAVPPWGWKGGRASGRWVGGRAALASIGERRPDLTSSNSGAAELAGRMPASWRGDCSAKGSGVTAGDGGAISVTVRTRDSTQRHFVGHLLPAQGLAGALCVRNK